MGPTYSNVLEGQGENQVLVTYNITWMSTTMGRNEPTVGCIDVMPIQHEPDGSCSQAQDDVDEDPYTNTTHSGSEEDSNSQSIDTRDNEDAVTPGISWNIPCIAHLYWGIWRADFYCTYNPHNHNFPPAEDGLYPFAIRSMNEWMEMALAGHPISVPRIVSAQPDEYGHAMLRFEITWRQQGLATNTFTLYAKRVPRFNDWDLSETESRNFQVLINTHNTQFMNPQVAHMQSASLRLADHDEESLKKSQGRVTRDSRRSRGGRVSGATGRGSFRGRGGFRGRKRGRVVHSGGHGRGGSRVLA
ncbi:hypothetical protein N7G274_006492 [Stereocaulon virgatum]|uniref:Uncharacterized protein n=1 Tax=Stereocaulon virgatum TaxID=373712 RepID=A0ABR4A4A7_9LECA